MEVTRNTNVKKSRLTISRDDVRHKLWVGVEHRQYDQIMQVETF